MIERLLAPRLTVQATVLGVVGGRMVRWNGQINVKGPADVRRALAAVGRAAGVNLLKALTAGDQPALLLDGDRILFPSGLDQPVKQGSRLSWLMPMAGG